MTGFEILIEVVMSLSVVVTIIFLVVLTINRKPIGITHMFNAKRRAIITEIISLVKNEPKKWKDVTSTELKKFPSLGIRVRDDWFNSESYISNRDHEYKLSFIECVRLSRHFGKLDKYQKAEKKREDAIKRDAAVDNILLTTTRMDEL